jgi:hypothetical protein
MAFVAKYFSREYLSKQIATLAKALESVSTNLSIIALLGLALIPMVPDRAASTLANQPSSPPTLSAPVPTAPVEVVRAKPVLVPQAPLQLEAALRPPPSLTMPDSNGAAEQPHFGDSLRVLARVSRERRRRAQQQAQPDSGDAGKAGAKTAAATTPVPNSKSEPDKAEPPVPDEWSEAEIITALKDCLMRVAPLGAEIDIAPAVKHEQCGAPAPVMLKRIGSGTNRVEFQPPPMLNCAMVASLHTWIEKTLQPTAQEVLGTSIVRLRGTGGYSCRNRAGSAHGDRLSEHALANAIDIMGFVTADGRTIDVLNKWGMTARDLREQKERAAQEKKERDAEQPKTVAAKMSDKEALEAAKNAAKQAQKEATEADRAAAKAPRSKRKQLQAEAQRKKDEAERKANEVERLGEEAERRAEELRRGSLRTAGLQKLGKGVDVKATDAKVNAKATPTTATANEATRPSTEATFLRRLHKGACGTFGTVLGPEANEAHRNHFHFDLAPRRRSSFCE